MALPDQTLHASSRVGSAFSKADPHLVINTVSGAFDSFTTVNGDGYYQGCAVATMMINIATEDVAAVGQLAQHIGQLLGQRSVGLETAGHYHSLSTA